MVNEPKPLSINTWGHGMFEYQGGGTDDFLVVEIEREIMEGTFEWVLGIGLPRSLRRAANVIRSKQIEAQSGNVPWFLG
jgi:hypothetical protein